MTGNNNNNTAKTPPAQDPPLRPLTTREPAGWVPASAQTSQLESRRPSPSPPTHSHASSVSVPPTVLDFGLVQPPYQQQPSTGDAPMLSLHAAGSNGSYTDEFRYKTIINYLNNNLTTNGWMPPATSRLPHDGLGVLMKKTRGHYVTHPEEVHPSLLACVQRLNLVVAFTMKTPMLQGILASLAPGQTDLRLMNGSQLQVAESLMSMAPTNIKKFQYACLVRQEGVLLIWHDDLHQVVPTAKRLEEKLLSLVWGEGSLPFSILQPSRPPSIMSTDNTSIYKSGAFNEKAPATGTGPGTGPGSTTTDAAALGGSSGHASMENLEKDESTETPESLARPVQRASACFIGLAMCLATVLLIGVYLSQLLIETELTGTYERLALLVCVPFLFCVSIFFFQIIFTDLFQLVGPIGGQKTNSRFFSCIRPSLRRAYMDGFEPPHITIQMPVYKEGMDSVIIPTVRSLQAAISFYESHGGSASIFINDDGLRVVPDDDAKRRVDFYHDNNIGWVARPKHGADGFLRKGKFKKASNMNFALNISQKVEDYLQQMVDARGSDLMIDEQDEEAMYESALARVLEENPLAHAAGNIRVGEFILIVDSDTRVPVDCLLYGAAEMFLSPEVAIVQHNTSVMQVSWDYFENGITFFTNLVYTAIRFSIGSGEVAPFVGHNAFLRWKAIQDVGVVEEDGYVAYWSESHVSEDFDIALRLQMKGNTLRLASYHGGGFQEGVSLTIYDEIARWQKYGFGVAEMIFHPFHRWIYKGPFTPLFYTFLTCNIMFSSKISIMAYMCSYFALGAGLLLTLLNYFLVGWYNDSLDHCYMTSWQVFIALIVVFNLLGHVSLAALRYRTGERTLLGSLVENFSWAPMMTVFFGGLAFHISGALLAYMFAIDMQWGATSKEKENSNFFREIPKILRTFKYMYAFLLLVVAGMIYLGRFAPRGWAISDFTAIVPLSVNVAFHALTPLVLNPSLMVFNY